MHDFVSIQYDQMRHVADEFQDVSVTIQSVLSNLQTQKDLLLGGEWKSSAATKFYQQMDDDVLPAVQRLELSLQHSSETCHDIIRIFEQAELEATQCIDFASNTVSEVIVSPQSAISSLIGIGTVNPAYPPSNPSTPGDFPDWFELRDDRDGGLNGAKDADTLFINGIGSDHEDHMSGIVDVSDALGGVPVTGIFNKTDNFILDSTQTFNDIYSSFTGRRFDDGNPAVDSAVQWIKDHPSGDIVVHSQGAAIISAALQEAARQGIDINGLNVTTLGGAGSYYPKGPTYNHIVMQNDPVPRTLNAFNLVGYDTNDSVHVVPTVHKGIVNLDSHDFQYYLDKMPNAAETARGFETKAIWGERFKAGASLWNPKAFVINEIKDSVIRGVSNELTDYLIRGVSNVL